MTLYSEYARNFLSHSHAVPVTVSFGETEYNFVENEVTGTIRVVTSRPSPVDFSFTVTARTLSYVAMWLLV